LGFFFATIYKYNPRENEIQLAPTLYHQAEVLMAILARYEWIKYSIIVTDFYGSEDFLRACEQLQYSENKKQYEIICYYKERHRITIYILFHFSQDKLFL
jgi:hypothetical protein